MVGVFSGLIVGVACTAFLILSNRDPYGGWNAGFLALCLNSVVAALVSLLSPIKAGVIAEDLSASAPGNS